MEANSVVAAIEDLTLGNVERWGRKARGLKILSDNGLPVPPGFVLSTDIYWLWRREHKLSKSVRYEIAEHISRLELRTSRQLGDLDRPLLMSVRSGSVMSLPGVLKTFLHVGLTDEILRRGTSFPTDVWPELQRRCTHQYADASIDVVAMFAKSPGEQVEAAIEAVFRHAELNSPTAMAGLVGLRMDLGTACIVQAMVEGLRCDKSGAGVYYTHHPLDGTAQPSGTFRWRSTGDDVVGGGHSMDEERPIEDLKRHIPDAFETLVAAGNVLGTIFAVPVEVEFTIENAKLWLLQVRPMGLSGDALAVATQDAVIRGTLRVADAARAILLARTRPVFRVEIHPPQDVDESRASSAEWARGLSVSSGVAVGPVALLSADRRDWRGTILVAESLDAHNHINAIVSATGLVTRLGGLSSHVATLARKLASPYVSGVADLRCDPERGTARVGDSEIVSGEMIWIDGGAGLVGRGCCPEPSTNTSAYASGISDLVRPYGGRQWFRTHRSSEDDVDVVVQMATHQYNHSKWRTRKARNCEVLQLLPKAWRMCQTVVDARDPQAIRDVMLEGIRQGFANGVKCTYLDSARLGRGFWQGGMETPQEVDAFLTDPHYRKASGHGGWPRWVDDGDVAEIIVVYAPPQRFRPAIEARGFAATMTVSLDPAAVVVELLLGSWRLRDFEAASSGDLIQLFCLLDSHSRDGRGPVVSRFGSHHVVGNSALPELRDLAGLLTFDGPRGSIRVCDPSVRERIFPDVLEAVEKIAHTLFFEWWDGQERLPVLMDAIERVTGIDTLEFQGLPPSLGDPGFFLIFDGKGSEEASAIEALANR